MYSKKVYDKKCHCGATLVVKYLYSGMKVKFTEKIGNVTLTLSEDLNLS